MKLQHILMATTILAVPGTALAQEAVDDNVILVTAQNRAQNVQDVPIAIEVVTGEALETSGVTDFTALQRVAPVLNVVSDTVHTRVTVRGIGSNSNDEAQDQAIAVNIDGEYLNRTVVLNASMFDIERVEVLRGPQGTLYGRNATGGAVNVITRKPGDDFGMNGSVSYGNYDALVLQGGMDIPIGDVGGIRAAGIWTRRDGYNTHPNTNTTSDDDNTRAGRLSLRLRPADGLTIDGAIEHMESDRVLAAQAFFNFNAPGNAPAANCATPGWTELAPLLANDVCIPNGTNNLVNVNRRSYDSPTTGVGFVDAQSWAYRGNIAYDFGGATLTYRVGTRSTERTSAVTLSPSYIFNTYIDTVDTQSHELRLNGESSLLTWQFGGFYFKESLEVERGLYRAPVTPPPIAFLGANGGYVNYFYRDLTSRSWALFGQTDVRLGDQLTAVLGLRYTDDRRRALYKNYGGGIFNPSSPFYNTGPVRITNLPNIAGLNLGQADDKLTWLVGLNYEPNADTLIYAKVSTGFKAGGFDAVGQYAPETNTAYEAGVKLNFGSGGQHIFNAAAFYYDYTDLQVGVLLDTTVGGQVFNAGAATVWGLEAETVLEVGDNGTFTASLNYLDSTYDSLFVAYPVFCVGCGLTAVGDLDPGAAFNPPNVDGNTPPFSPKWTITVGYDHEIDLGGAGSLTASVFTNFKSAYYTDIFNFNDSRQKAYTQTDASLTWQPENQAFSIQAFVRNIENTRPLTYANFTAAGADDIYNWQFGAPRTYGVRLGFEF